MSGIINKKGHYILNDKLLFKKHKKKLENILPYSDNISFKKKKFSIYNTIKISEEKKYCILPRNFGIYNYGIKKSYCKEGLDVAFPSIYVFPKPREYQENVINTIYKDYNKGNYGGLICLSPGSGKTYISLRIMKLIGKKTLIVTDKNRADQFVEEIIKYFPTIKRSEIGILQNSPDGSVLTDDSKKIVISVINTIANGKFKFDKYASFGFSIMDEIDSYISPKMLNVFKYITPRYIMGMSATLTRPDKLGYLIKWYIGDIKFKHMNAYIGAKQIVRRLIYNSNNEVVYRKNKWNNKKVIDPTNTYKLVMNDKVRESLIIKTICFYYVGKLRNEEIKNIGNKYGKILVIGLYRKQLEDILKKLIEIGINKKDVGIYYGAKTKKDKEELRRVVNECKIVLAIRSMAYKGLNIPDSDIMIMASSYIPKNGGYNTESLTQLLGRITRKNHVKSPIIVDIIDNFGFFIKHGRLRNKYYKSQGFTIVKEILK
jgi:superfamily II DNA or RNA helicase